VVAAGEDGGAADGESASYAVDRLLEHLLAAGQRHRRQELAVGLDLEPLAAPAHADEALDLVVEGRELGVGDRLVVAEAVAARRLEVPVAHPVRLAPPHDGAPADLVAADPPEGPLPGEGKGS
jgi:hypothetical protein